MTRARHGGLAFEWGAVLAALQWGCGSKSGLDLEPCLPDPAGETCNGQDDDCDGLVDEDIEPVRCGDNGCETLVTCEDGHMPACVAKVAEPESCNLRDDDCDGEVDEGLGFGPLGAAVVLRHDEFDTGGCSSCSWAWGATLAPDGDLWTAVWNLGLSGGDEQPTLYGRRIDGWGDPTEGIRLLRDDFLLDIEVMQALEPLPPLGLPFDAMVREPDGGDVGGILFVGRGGEASLIAPTPSTGPYDVPRTVWTGERFVSAWMQDDGLHMASLAADGGDVRTIEVDPLVRPVSITMAVHPGRVGVIVSRYRADPERRDEWFVLLDRQGEVVAPARQVDVEYATWQRLIGTEDGWLHIRPNAWQEASTHQTLDADGDPTGDPLEFEDGRHYADAGTQDVFVPSPTSTDIVSAWQSSEGGEVHIEILDERGDVKKSWSGTIQNDGPYDFGFFVDPHISFSGDHILLAWHGLASDNHPNPVYVIPVGCIE